MKRLTILCALLALTFATALTPCADAQEKYSDTEIELLREGGFLGGKALPAEGLGVNPTVKMLREYYSLSWSGMEDGDKYSPAWTAVSSAILPGSGQMICGKAGRGVLFLLGTAAPATAAILTYKGSYVNAYGYPEKDITHTAALVGVAVAMWVWNIVDAMEVAVLTNKYNRDMNAARAKLSMNPYLSTNPLGATSAEPVVGMSLVLNF